MSDTNDPSPLKSDSERRTTLKSNGVSIPMLNLTMLPSETYVNDPERWKMIIMAALVLTACACTMMGFYPASESVFYALEITDESVNLSTT